MSGGAPGFFGKVPGRGDFLSRRVPSTVAERWDAWLQALVTAVRDQAGEEWPEAWLTAPLWHFALGAGLAPPTGVAGVMIASVDRVGRMFPFTLIGPCAGLPDEAWSSAMEAEILAALDDGFDPDRLDAALLAIGAPPDGPPLGPEQSVWWSQGSDRMGPARLTVEGMPRRDTSTAMVLGGIE